MHLCSTNQIVIAIISKRKNSTIYQVLKDWNNLIDNKDSLSKNQFFFTSQGKLSQEQQITSNSFTIFKNQILKDISIKKKKKLTPIYRALLPNQKQKLQKGSIIKLGMKTIEVYDIYPLKEHNQHKEYLSQKNIQKTKKNDQQKLRCRICFGETQNYQDPLLNFCKCSGSVKYMHLDCYRQWFMKKVKINYGQKITHFQYSDIKCDLCKEVMPFSVQKNNIKYSILDYKKQYKKYNSLLQPYDNLQQNLEQYSNDSSVNFIGIDQSLYYQDSRIFSNSFQQEISKEKKNQSYCIVLKIDTKNFENVKNSQIILIKMYPEQLHTMGTGFMCKIIFNSALISRQHAVIYLEGKTIFIEDLYSDHGTFINLQLNKQYQFLNKEGLLLQHTNGNLIYLKSETGFFSFFQSNIKYTLKCE